jgi:hypothetical protein
MRLPLRLLVGLRLGKSRLLFLGSHLHLDDRPPRLELAPGQLELDDDLAGGFLAEQVAVSVKVQAPDAAVLVYGAESLPSGEGEAPVLAGDVPGPRDLALGNLAVAEADLVGLDVDEDPVHDGGVVGDGADEARVAGLWVWKEVAQEGVAERLVVENASVYEALCLAVLAMIGGVT